MKYNSAEFKRVMRLGWSNLNAYSNGNVISQNGGNRLLFKGMIVWYKLNLPIIYFMTNKTRYSIILMKY